MAGNYPDVPAYKFAYDRDGTIGFVYSIGGVTEAGWAPGVTQLSTPTLAALNDEDSDTPMSLSNNGNAQQYVGLIFPEQRNLAAAAFFYDPNAGSVVSVQTSPDTTTGTDGTWNTFGNINTTRYVETNYRSLTYIQTVSVNGIKGIRFQMPGGSNSRQINGFHLYGSIPAANSPDRLRILDLSSNDIAAQLDFGDVSRGTSSTKQFVVLNNSSTLTANNITVSLEALTDTTPALVGQFQLSTDNVTFTNSINIGSLAPGASSGTLYLRDNVDASATLSLWSVRMVATAASFS
jgi:hypothetical protein